MRIPILQGMAIKGRPSEWTFLWILLGVLHIVLVDFSSMVQVTLHVFWILAPP